MIDLPRLEDYDVSPITGFLPEELPLEKLPQEYYKPWEDLVSVLSSLILTKRIRSVVDEKMPLLEVDRLANDAQYRRAYSILTFLAHAYVWGVGEPKDKLPIQISQPLLRVSAHLEIPPVLTYSGCVLWNYKEIFKGEDISLENIDCITTFTGGIDENWFYLVSVYFEYKGANCIVQGLEALKSARNGQIEKVTAHLQQMADAIDELGSVMMQMEDMCDPHIFYFRIRPYLAGWKNMTDAGLPNGVIYGDEKLPRAYSGGSNAQSSLIQALDLLLNVEHHATGENEKVGRPGNSFINEMREYMPGKHRRFLEHLSKVNNIHEYVRSNSDNEELVLSYDACLAMLKSFRDKHIQIVTRYIILQAQKSRNLGSTSTKTVRSGLAKKSSSQQERGTGGTALLPFLKQCRDETGSTAASSWGKRMLVDGMLQLKIKPVAADSVQDDNNIVGLAGSWNNDNDQKKGHW
ncbi:hypothetical protein LJB42_002334 [Komagataella kurtzmanii]|nr:hypothetical protein LJB42_002334 [Komagataella kurtzmanii]